MKRFFKFNRELAKQLNIFSQADYSELSRVQKEISAKVKNKEYATSKDLNNDLNSLIINILDKKKESSILGSDKIKYDKANRKDIVISLRESFLKFMELDVVVLENNLLKKEIQELKKDDNLTIINNLEQELDTTKAELATVSKRLTAKSQESRKRYNEIYNLSNENTMLKDTTRQKDKLLDSLSTNDSKVARNALNELEVARLKIKQLESKIKEMNPVDENSVNHAIDFSR